MEWEDGTTTISYLMNFKHTQFTEFFIVKNNYRTCGMNGCK